MEGGRVQFHSSACGKAVYQYHLLKRLPAFPCMSWHICQRSTDRKCMDLSLGSILSHWCVCLLGCQHHAVLITAAMQYTLKSGSVRPPASSFFLKVALMCSRSFVVPYKFSDFISTSVKNIIGLVIEIAVHL